MLCRSVTLIINHGQVMLDVFSHFQLFLIFCVSLLSLFAGIYLLKVNNRNTRRRCETCSKLTIKTPEERRWCRSGIFIVNFEHISNPVLVFLLLTLNMYLSVGNLSASLQQALSNCFHQKCRVLDKRKEKKRERKRYRKK